MGALEQVDGFVSAGLERIGGVSTTEELRSLDADLLGKRSVLATLKGSMRDLDPDQRKALGAALHEARRTLTDALAQRAGVLAAGERRAQLEADRLDLTEGLGRVRRGHLHPVTQTWQRLEDIFVGMGFIVAEGPEIETDWYNFTALNLPEHHPARGMHDTFHLELGAPGETVLRTHTSPIQIRLMQRAVQEGWGPPIYAIAPGRVYRNERTDSTHLAVFHQIEGLVVDRGINMGHLAGTVDTFLKAYFGADTDSRLSPSYFPFTEPSAEVHMRVGGGGWLELAGCGMVHPEVLRNGGIDPEEFTGFAFGFGIDRLTKMRHDIDDLRELYTNDARFLNQF